MKFGNCPASFHSLDVPMIAAASSALQVGQRNLQTVILKPGWSQDDSRKLPRKTHADHGGAARLPILKITAHASG